MKVRAVLEAAGAAAVAGLLGVVVSRAIPGASPAEAQLPLFTALAALATAPATERLRAGAFWSIPLMLLSAVALPAEMRLPAFGVLLGGSIAASAVGAMSRGSLPLATGAWLLAVATSVRLFPFELRGSSLALLAIAGGVGLVLAISQRALFPAEDCCEPAARWVPVTGFLLAAALVFIVPASDPRGAVVPALAAVIVVAVRTGRIDLAIVAVAGGLLAGRWMVAAAAVALLGRMVGSWIRPGASLVVAPLARVNLDGMAAGLIFAPGAGGGLFSAPLPWRLAGVGVLILSLAVRPFPALVLALIALLLVSDRPLPLSRRLTAIPAGLAIGLMTLAGSSGAIAPLFPAAIPLEARLLLVAGAFLALVVPFTAFGIFVAAGAVASIAMLPMAKHVEEVGLAAAPSESVVIAAPLPANRLRLVLSGANVAGLRGDAPFATLEVLDARGSGGRREVSLEEVADWGAYRPGFIRRSVNRFPHAAGYRVEGRGRDAWMRGEGVIELEAPAAITRIRITAAPTLPPDASVQVERVVVPR